jgi:hypothetical protein
MRLLVTTAFAALALAACSRGDATSPERLSTRKSAPVDATLLLSPEDNAVFAQNDPTIGCPAHPTRGYGFRTSFDWKDVEGASEYRIVFHQRDARFPAIERTVTSSEFAETMCNAFVADQNREHWNWQVIALASVAVPGDSGTARRDTVLMSTSREYSFAPCRLANGAACYAPAPSDTSSGP